MPLNAIRPARRAGMRGLSLVELMVGVAVSLFVVAAAALLVSSQLTDNRRLLLETQVHQDLRSTADIVTRELRRTSYWASAMNGAPVPLPAASSNMAANPMLAMAVSGSASSSTVHYKYQRASGTQAFGFSLNNNGVIVACQSDGSGPSGVCGESANPWQELTDKSTVRITQFSISTQRPGSNTSNDDAQLLPCPYPCADGSSNCWPRVGVREFTVFIAGESRSDARVKRSLSSSVRVRNENIQLSTEAPAGQACPPG